MKNKTSKPEFVYINVFRVYREYGGPEEGGWYYDAGNCIESVRCIKGGAGHKAVLEEMKERFDNKRPNRYDQTTSYRISIQNHKGRDFPEVTPHYE